MKKKNWLILMVVCFVVCLATIFSFGMQAKTTQSAYAADVYSEFEVRAGTITAYRGGGNVTIPAMIGEEKITAIASNAFNGRIIETLNIMAPNINIMNRAFYGAHFIGESPITIQGLVGDYAFANTRFTNGAPHITINGSVGNYAFNNAAFKMSENSRITVRGSVGEYAFYNSTIKCVEVYGGDIGKYAFYNTSNLQTLKIEEVGSIGNYAFLGAGNGKATVSIQNQSKNLQLGIGCFAGNGFKSISCYAGLYQTLNNMVYNPSSGIIFGIPFGDGTSNISFTSNFKGIAENVCENSKLGSLTINMTSTFTIYDYAFKNANINSIEMRTNANFSQYCFYGAIINVLKVTGSLTKAYCFTNSTIKNLHIETDVTRGYIFSSCYIYKVYLLNNNIELASNCFSSVYKPSGKEYAIETLFLLEKSGVNNTFINTLSSAGLLSCISTIAVLNPGTIFTGATAIKNAGFAKAFDERSYRFFSKHETYCSVTATAEEGGTISNLGTISYIINESATYSITPDEGYEISTVKVDGAAVDLKGKTTYTFENITDNHTINATFTKVKCKVILDYSSGGSVTVSNQNVSYGDSITITITPNEGKEIQRVSFSTNLTIYKDSSYTVNSYTNQEIKETYTLEIKKDTYVYVNFKTKVYSVNFYSEDGSTLLETKTISHGGKATYTTPTKESTAEYTYSFNKWVTEPNGETEAVLTNITEEKKFYATFIETKNKYQITWMNGDQPLEVQEVEYGEMPECLIVPIKDADEYYTYTFAGWAPEIVSVTGNATYYAQYNGSTRYYEISFQNYNGSELDKQTLEYGATPVYDETPVKAGNAQYSYVFIGWSPAIAEVTGDAIYIAQYEAIVNKYKVFFYSDNGTELAQCEVEYGKDAAYPYGQPSKESNAEFSYTFSKWVTEPNGETDAVLTSIKENKNFYATFTETKNKYQIVFKNYDGTVVESLMVEYGAMPVCEEIPVKPSTEQHSYAFAGWNPKVVAVTGNATYTAQFTETVRTYTIIFKNDDGAELDKQTLEYGATPVYDETPVKAGNAQYSYVFIGWSPAIVEVTGNAVYIAQYEEKINTYEIVFQNYDGSELDKQILEYGATPVYAETPTRASTEQQTYIFIGWAPEIVPVTGNKVYVAQYEERINVYEIVFQNYDGSELDKQTLVYGETPVYEGTPTRDADAQYSYVFIGWSPAIAEVTGDVIYTAQYDVIVNKYKVFFYSDNGTELAQCEVEYGKDAAYPYGQPTKESNAEFSYAFSRWVTELNGTVEDNLQNVIGNRKVYATFTETKNKYQIVFKNYDGTVYESLMVEYGAMPVCEEIPVKPSTEQHLYTFAGWDPAVVAVTGDATYTAQFTETARTYTIIFKNDDEVELDKQTLEYGATPVYDETPVKAGNAQYSYAFIGWSPDITEVTGDAVYVAQYEEKINTYEIVFQNYNGTILQLEQLEYGAMPSYKNTTPIKQASAQYTYTFVGWNKDIAEVTGNATYTAQYEETINSYEIVFKNYDGTELQNETLEYGITPVYKGEIPVKEGNSQYYYEFIGWSAEIVKVNKRAVYVAQFAQHICTYTINLVIDGDFNLVCNQSLENVEYGSNRTFRIVADFEKYDVEVYANDNKLETNGETFTINQILEDLTIRVKLIEKNASKQLIVVGAIAGGIVLTYFAVSISIKIKRKNKYNKYL